MRVPGLTVAVVLLTGLCGAMSPLQAQVGSVTGSVRAAESGQPLVGVQVVIVGTNQGGLTNAQGRFLLTGETAGEQQIRASSIGYGQETRTVTVPAGDAVVIEFMLQTSVIGIDGVVVNAVTGREQRARELGTNVAQIDIARQNPATITSFSDALGGRAAGVVLGDVNGTTGTSQRIRIRGANSLSLSNEPLIFVDGILVSGEDYAQGLGGQETSRLNDINPADIENMEVLKGPAASALYGTAAANGVILITTKRGIPGSTQWEAYAEVGQIDDVTEYPDNFRSYTITDATQPVFLPSGLFNTAAVSTCENRAAAAGTCTQDATSFFNTGLDPRTSPFSTGNRNRYGLSVRGGGEDVTFFVSGAVESEQGVIDFNTLDKINVRGNLDAKLSEDVDLGFSVGYTDSGLRLNGNDNNAESPIINALVGYPNLRVEDDGVTPSRANYGFGRGPNEFAARFTEQAVDRLTASSQLRFRPTEWLSFNANGGVDFTAQHDFQTVQPNGPLGIFSANNNAGTRSSDRSNFYVYTARLAGVASFELTPALTSNTTVGGSYDQSTVQRSECFGVGLVAGTASCGTVSDQFAIDEDFSEVKTVGGYVQQEFGWRDRVFAAASIRGDDNSAFGTDFGFVYFPSASLSWVIGEEEWFPESNILSNLRLRTAWGTSGLRPGFRDAATLYSPLTVATDAGNESGVVLSTTGNDLLEPEKSTEFEVGFEAGLFSNRLGVDFTFFDKKSVDALIQRRLPGSLGLTTTVFDNLGEIQNSGTELTLNLDVYQSDNFGINVGFTNTTLTNTVNQLGEGVDPIILNRGLQRHEEGFTAGGFWQERYTYSDSDGDGLLQVSDVVLSGDGAEFIGPSLPTWNRTLFADVRLLDFITVSTLFEGRGGHYQGNDSFAFRCQVSSVCAARSNPNSSVENQARYIADSFLGSAYGYVEKADFWRWRELSVSVEVPEQFTNAVGQLRGLRVTLAGRNLATFTDYTGLDPETNETGASTIFNQSEFNTQPPVRLLMLRLDYRF